MKSATRLYIGLLLTTTLLWLLADTLLPDPFTYFSFRHVFNQYSGVIAITVMSLAMILAARSAWLEVHLNGLDKMYRLHKWLGITALVASVLHWWFAKGTKWMVGWGWLERPERGPKPEQVYGLIEGIFRSVRSLAKDVGEWAFYGAALLMVLALIKRFPYHWFKKTHTLIAVAYLALVFHAVVLVEFDYWSQPIGWLLAVLMLAGTAAALWILAGRVGKSRTVAGQVEDVTRYPEMQSIATRIRPERGWPGHQAGQFAFLKTCADEEPHPFTIASAWNPAAPVLVFISKALGDYTARMLDELAPGTAVSVQGPYGCFNFEDSATHQIWIGGGIGITPFIARMQQLQQQPGSQQIDLYYAVAEINSDVLEQLQAAADQAGVTLHLVLSGQHQRLTAAQIMAELPTWRQASVWFCGPSVFGQQLKRDLSAAGMPRDQFHQEMFEMR
ncbi:ferric reductase-like transmembrane domain-containing protein [Oceanobacter sp. 4_MG-2023]|uniref:ferredoxin reductase family protein n=1 Tax=Oceanobacter sp. 4_MG-2023 TaxID=3062623 RepID=UPI0027336A1D|nr:ferric reductase-like transmembrane domain-containing protein [Oceanobacter sp. 4_MG-2023]MDP2547852.1 ferric reductase-like transmembrane domain-containing protein [Oceanobacter sp. 4_MG-2023]